MFKILIKDHGFEDFDGLWISSYKLIDSSNIVMDLHESEKYAGLFEEDDYIIELCKKKFKKVGIVEE